MDDGSSMDGRGGKKVKGKERKENKLKGTRPFFKISTNLQYTQIKNHSAYNYLSDQKLCGFTKVVIIAPRYPAQYNPNFLQGVKLHV